jgi:integrase
MQSVCPYLMQAAAEFSLSLKRKGVSAIYIRSATASLKRFTDAVSGNIADVTVADINRFLHGLKKLGPVSKNGIRRNIVTMFGFAKRNGYLHPDRKTAAEQSETFKEEETEIEIFTPEEMERLLLAAHARILPLIAIGGFAGIRSAEVARLEWQDIKWDRGHIEIAARADLVVVAPATADFLAKAAQGMADDLLSTLLLLLSCCARPAPPPAATAPSPR